MGQMEVSSTFSLEEVRKMKLDIYCANLLIRESEEAKEIIVSAKYEETGDYNCKIKDDKLKIKYKWNRRKKHLEDTADSITVQIPTGAFFEKIELDLGAGNTEIELVTVEAGNAAFDVGAGNLAIQKLKVKEKLKVDVGAGKVKMNQMTAAETSVDCGVGGFSFSGTVHGDLKVDCGVGSCEILLDADEKDYNYEVSGGLGKVVVNGSRYGGIGASHSVKNTDTVGTIRISCGVGSVSLSTLPTQNRIEAV